MEESGEVATVDIHISGNSTAEVPTASQVKQDQTSDCCNSLTQTRSPDRGSGEQPKDNPKENEAQSQAGERVSQQERQPEAASSPEPNCSICLGKMENKSFTNSCFHQFCFTCLLEWSKVKPECPLCKQPFKSIVHNVRSMEDYDQYHLRFEDFNSWENPDGRRFRYRSTLTSERRRELTLSRFLTSHQLVPSAHERSTRSAAVVSTSGHRRFIYEMDLWVRRPPRLTRFRETSPQFYTQNPACTHRLVPWLNRELIALQYGHQAAFLMELILSLILRFPIQSPEFEELIRPYFLRNTKHFIHEFYNFARSPYDMVDYDRYASYLNNADIHSPTDVGNGSDSDVIVLSPDRSSRPRWSQRPTTFPRPTSEAHVTPVINRTREFLESLRAMSGTLSSRREASAFRPVAPSIPLPPSPQPGPSGLQSTTTTFFVNDLDASTDEDNSRPTVIQSSTSNQLADVSNMKVEVVIPDDVDDDDDCIVVGYEKPLLERSPVDVIVLSDESSEDEGMNNVSPTDQALDLSQPTSSTAECDFPQPGHSKQRCSSTSSSPNRSKLQDYSASSSAHGSKQTQSSISSSPSHQQQTQSDSASTSKVSTPSKRSHSSRSKSKGRHKHHGKHHHKRSKKRRSRSRSLSSHQDSSDEDYVPNAKHRKTSKKKRSHKCKKSKPQGKNLSLPTEEK